MTRGSIYYGGQNIISHRGLKSLIWMIICYNVPWLSSWLSVKTAVGNYECEQLIWISMSLQCLPPSFALIRLIFWQMDTLYINVIISALLNLHFSSMPHHQALTHVDIIWKQMWFIDLQDGPMAAILNIVREHFLHFWNLKLNGPYSSRNILWRSWGAILDVGTKQF